MKPELPQPAYPYPHPKHAEIVAIRVKVATAIDTYQKELNRARDAYTRARTELKEVGDGLGGSMQALKDIEPLVKELESLVSEPYL